MKNIILKNLDVQELSISELKFSSGGMLPAILASPYIIPLIGIFIVSVIGGATGGGIVALAVRKP